MRGTLIIAALVALTAAGVPLARASCGTNLVMVTGDGGFGLGSDDAKRLVFAGWGYNVIAIDDDAPQASFDTAAAANHVLFVSDTAGAGTGTKLRGLRIGIVSEQVQTTWQDLMYAAGSTTAGAAATTVNVNDDLHPITNLSGGGVVTIHSPASNIQYWATSIPPGARVLAERVGNPAHLFLIAFESGAEMFGSNVGVDRRVLIGTQGSDPSGWTNALRQILSKSLSFASCGVPWYTDPLYLKRKYLCLDGGRIAGNLSDFPALVSFTDTELTDALASGHDLLFTAADGVTRLDYERESWDQATGTISAWVRFPSLTAGVDEPFFLYFDKDSELVDQQTPAGVWDAGYRGVWHLGEDQPGTGTAALYRDSTPNGFHGTDFVSATGKSGKIGRGQALDGTDDYIALGSTTIVDGTDAFTFAGWVRLDAVAGANDHFGLYGRYGGTDVGAFRVLIGDWAAASDSRPSLASNIGVWNDIFATSHVPIATWTHVAMTYDGAGTVDFYVNGVHDGTAAYTEPSVVAGASQFLGAAASFEFFTHGTLDELRLSSTNRSADWIQTSYDNQNDPGGFLNCVSSATTFDVLRTVTVDRTRIPGACGPTLASYPMLLSVSNVPDLAHTSSGGSVTDLEGDDIVFRAMDDATCGGPGSAPCLLDHEIERYASSTGELVAWVRLPSVNTAASGSDTVIGIFYGNEGIDVPTESPAAVWDASYRAVWHMGEASPLDSTANAFHGTQSGGVTTTAAGRIGAASNFDGIDDYVTLNDLGDSAQATVEVWFRSDTFGVNEAFVSNGVFTAGSVHFKNNSGLVVADPSGGIAAVSPATSTGTWYHAVYTYTNGGSVVLFLDGSPVAAGSTTASDWNGTNLEIGHEFTDYSSGVRFFDGILDEARVSDVVRSDCWIGASFENQDHPGDLGDPGFYSLGAPTLVELVSFSAAGIDNAVRLEWETASELDNLGFHLHRSESEGGPFARITDRLIPGLGSSPVGASYQYRDTNVLPGTAYFYRLEDIDTSGVATLHQTVTATPRSGISTPDVENGARIVYGNPSEVSMRSTERSGGVIEIDLVTGGFVATPQEDGSVVLSIPGYVEGGSPGAPALPVKRAWVNVVAGRKVKLLSVEESEVESFSGLVPAVADGKELVAGEDGTVRLRSESRGRHHRSAPGGLTPDRAARIVDVAFQADAKKALVEMAPLRFRPSTGELHLAKRLRVRLAVYGREQGERRDANGRARRPRGTRVRAQRQVVAHLHTREPGIYEVPFEHVFAKRRRPIPASQLRLSRRGQAIAFRLAPSSGSYGPGSSLIFVGEGAAANPYDDTAVYELELGERGLAMSVRPNHKSAEVVTSVRYRVEAEENRYYQPGLVDAPDLWFWDTVSAHETKSFPFEVVSLANGSELSRLELRLQGMSDSPEMLDHHVRLYVNGTFVHEIWWNGKESKSVEAAIASETLRDGENVLEIENAGDTGAAHSIVMLDRFAVTHPRSVIGIGGQLVAEWPRSGLSSFGRSFDGTVYDVSTAHPVFVAALAGDGFVAEAGHRYRVVEAGGALRPEVRAPVVAGLADRRMRADYVVIAPLGLLDAARPLLAKRAREGLQVESVSTEAIFSEFGYGESRPEAIRDFLAHAYHHWAVPPRYVLLLGDASYDFKDYLQLGRTLGVPSMTIRTRFLWTASDPSYAAVNGDDILPDLAIGRLPAGTIEEARTMVAKILAYEAGETSLRGPAVLVADNADLAGSFEADADALAMGILSGRDVRKIYLRDLGAAASRDAVLTAFDDGASLMSYVGHGGIQLWATENLFDTEDVASLSLQSHQPVLLTMNCLNGYFHFPFFDSLSEELVKAEGRGAIAAVSPSGLSLNAPAHVYHRSLLEALTSGAHARLGDAVLEAQRRYADTGALPELLRIYHLFGDPAMRVK